MDPLFRRPQLIPAVAREMVREWGHLYAAWTLEDAVSELSIEAETPAIPRTFVATSEERVIGFASLIASDLPELPELGPWLANVWVHPDFRKSGLGRNLVCNMLDHALCCRVSSVYLFTESADVYFARFGFERYLEATAHGAPVRVMRKAIQGSV